MKSIRAFRGAIQLNVDASEEMRMCVAQLLKEILESNSIENEDLISMLFTATPDLTCEFPAVGARVFGITDVPLICASEIDVKGALPRTVRVLLHAESSLTRAEITHVYLNGAEILRPDLGNSAKNQGSK
jgi:chorismate mutase